MDLTPVCVDLYDSFGVFKHTLTNFGYSRARCTSVDLPKVLKYSSKLCRILGKIWKFQTYFSTFTSIQRGRESGGKEGLQESKNFKIGQNVFKGPKTIIESRPSITLFQQGPYRDTLRGSSDGPSRAPQVHMVPGELQTCPLGIL